MQRDAGSFPFLHHIGIRRFLSQVNIAHVFKEVGGMDGGTAQCWSTCLAQMSPLAASPAPSTIIRTIIMMIIILIRFSLGLGV